MIMIWRSMKASLYKMVHAKLLWVHLLLPSAAAVICNLYFLSSVKTEWEEVQLYLQIIAMAFPLMIAVVTTMVYEEDYNAGECQLLRMLPSAKWKGHMGNLLALLGLGTVAVGLAVVCFGYVYRGAWTIVFYGKAAGLLYAVNLAGYLIQYMVCYSFGKGMSLALGITNMLLSALMYMSMGDAVWRWIPCSYGMRMVSYYLLREVSAAELQTHIIDYVNHDWHMGIVTAAGVTVLLGLLFCIWADKWQGAGAKFE